MIVSKELLSEVLGYKVTKFTFNGKMLGINPSQRRDKPSSCVVCKEHINIHELAHKVKEWAFDNGYCLGSSKMRLNEGFRCFLVKDMFGDAIMHQVSQDADTEPEAIFKAGQWILDNR